MKNMDPFLDDTKMVRKPGVRKNAIKKKINKLSWRQSPNSSQPQPLSPFYSHNLQLRLRCACAATAMRVRGCDRGMNTIIYESVFNCDCDARANPRSEHCIIYEMFSTAIVLR
jgi:hypothetical protein